MIGWASAFINPKTDFRVNGYGITRCITTEEHRILQPLIEEGGLMIQRTESGLITEIVNRSYYAFVAVKGVIVNAEPVEWIGTSNHVIGELDSEFNVKFDPYGRITHWGFIHNEDYLEWKLKQ